MNIVNLTPHAVRVIAPDGRVTAEIPPSGDVARVAMTLSPAGEFRWSPPGEGGDGENAGHPVFIPLAKSGAGRVTGVPMDITAGSALILSRICAEALRAELADDSAWEQHARTRSHLGSMLLLVPADLVRDASGAVVGCRALEVVS